MQVGSGKRLARIQSAAIVLAALAGSVASCCSKNPDALTEMNLDENQANDAMNAVASAPANTGDNSVEPVQSIEGDDAAKPAPLTNAVRPTAKAVPARANSTDADGQAPRVDEDQGVSPEIPKNTDQPSNEM